MNNRKTKKHKQTTENKQTEKTQKKANTNSPVRWFPVRLLEKNSPVRLLESFWKNKNEEK